MKISFPFLLVSECRCAGLVKNTDPIRFPSSGRTQVRRLWDRSVSAVWIMTILAFTSFRPASSQSLFDIFEARTFEDTSGLVMPYRLFIPEGYDPAVRYPLVIQLHGSGERGTDNRLQLTANYVLLKRLVSDSVQSEHPCFVMAPQCPVNGNWSSLGNGGIHGYPAQMAQGLSVTWNIIDQIISGYSIDTTRVYMTGSSMGGYGAWESGYRFPLRLAAILPVCGASDPVAAERLLSTSVWAFHGIDDPVVGYTGSSYVIDQLKIYGGNPRFTTYEGYTHFIWDIMGAEPDILSWMFNQRACDHLKHIPVVNVSEPEYAEVYSADNVRLSLKATDDLTVDSLYITYNNRQTDTICGDTASLVYGPLADTIHTFSIQAVDNEGLRNKPVVWKILHGDPNTIRPYNGTPFSPPGTLEAENFDYGGEGIAYHDADFRVTDKTFRGNEDIDLAAIMDGDPNQAIAFVESGEWVEYTLFNPQADTFIMYIRYATNIGRTASHVGINGQTAIPKRYVPYTNGWGIYKEMNYGEIWIPGGYQTLRFVFDSLAINLDYLRFVAKSTLNNRAPFCEQLRLYPNPTTDRFRITGGDGGVLEIYDVRGTLLLRQPDYDGREINIQSMPEAVYVIVLRRKNQVPSVFRLVKTGTSL